MTLDKGLKKILVTGGAGFIGNALIRRLIELGNYRILNIDKYGYASDLTSIENKLKELKIENKDLYKFSKIDICDFNNLENAILDFKPDIIFNLAAETHVDRSIDDPYTFLQNNIFGTFNLLKSALNLWKSASKRKKDSFRFIHISTDEVFGSLQTDKKFNEKSKYMPNSPYSASKASSDHLVRAWNKTYGLPTIITNCSNNFGPWQYPEKLIPNTILKICANEEIPIYGNGNNIRDWLFVKDHIEALLIISKNGRTGESYCIGGENEKSNLEVVKKICEIINKSEKINFNSFELISFVEDRPGHDFRYSIDIKKIKKELKWYPKRNFEDSLEETINWYLINLEWCKEISARSGFKGMRIGLV